MALKLSMIAPLGNDQKEDLKESFLRSLVFRKAAIAFFKEKIDSTRKKSRSEKFILDGDFAQKMAWNMGYEKAMSEFIDLLSSEPEK